MCIKIIFYSPTHYRCISYQSVNSAEYLDYLAWVSLVCCIISTLCTVLWPVVALRCEVNNWMDPLINKVQGERGRGGRERRDGRDRSLIFTITAQRVAWLQTRCHFFLLCALSLSRRCLDIIRISCSELWLWARSRMWHFNTFPLWSTGTRLLPVKQVEGGNMELPPQSRAKSTFDPAKLFSSRPW